MGGPSGGHGQTIAQTDIATTGTRLADWRAWSRKTAAGGFAVDYPCARLLQPDAGPGRSRRGAVDCRPTAGAGDIRVLDGVIVADADVFVPDGSRLEGVGVQLDVLALPTPDDFLEKDLDPVLAKTAASFGVTIDSQRAGRLSRQ